MKLHQYFSLHRYPEKCQTKFECVIFLKLLHEPDHKRLCEVSIQRAKIK